jgi:hypothetical protein
MAATTKGSRNKMGRREVLGAGALALGAALLPRSAGAAQAASSEYAATLERIAAALRPGFESGEYRGWTDEDDELDNHLPRTGYDPPLWKLERECARLIGDARTAAVVLFGSPNAADGWFRFEMDHELRAQIFPVDDEYDPADLAEVFRIEMCGKAGLALSCDVLQVARARGWYKPAPSERTPGTTLDVANGIMMGTVA